MQKTKIVCTIGPSCNNYKTLSSMLKAGMTVARLNMSHGDLEYHQQIIDLVKQVRQDLNMPCAIMLDTRGPEIRIGEFLDGKVTLKKGKMFTFTSRKVKGTDKIVSLRFPKLVKLAKKGMHIYANNGLLDLKVIDVTATDINCKIVTGGPLSNNKSIALPRVPLDVPYLNDIDKEHIAFAVKNNLDIIACSFVNREDDIIAVRKYLAKLGCKSIDIVSKIESAEGIKNLDSIIEISDGIMVARGDMGSEVPMEQIPYIQKTMINKTVNKSKYIIVATEMLESMIEKRRPTRAETTDVANAIYDNTSATMLSGETASGMYPVEAVTAMANIAKATEKVIDYNKAFAQKQLPKNNTRNAIAFSACATAHALDAKAILCFSHEGNSARAISSFRPAAKIVAITNTPAVVNKLAICWGITPVLCETIDNTDDMFKRANNIAKELKVAKPGDTIIITSGVPVNNMGKTNLIKVHVVE